MRLDCEVSGGMRGVPMEKLTGHDTSTAVRSWSRRFSSHLSDFFGTEDPQMSPAVVESTLDQCLVNAQPKNSQPAQPKPPRNPNQLTLLDRRKRDECGESRITRITSAMASVGWLGRRPRRSLPKGVGIRAPVACVSNRACTRTSATPCASVGQHLGDSKQFCAGFFRVRRFRPLVRHYG